MTVRSLIRRVAAVEALNFVLTNRIPRRLATRFMGWFSKIEQPLVRDLSIGIWRLFADLDLADAKKKRFRSMHECFVRELREGARPIDADPALLVSPCDAIVGAAGRVEAGMPLQAKGFAYSLQDLLHDPRLAELYRDGCYATLRLTSGMYHRFHAPHDCRVTRVDHIPGDTWNVNPIALKRVERLFCKNERAVIRTSLQGTGHIVTLVPVAAILVAGIRLRFLDVAPPLKQHVPRLFSCDVALRKGEEMGWFEQGSTIIVFAPAGFALAENVRGGNRVRVGRPLMRLP